MYIGIFSIQHHRHLFFIDNISYNLTVRLYDNDNFNAKGTISASKYNVTYADMSTLKGEYFYFDTEYPIITTYAELAILYNDNDEAIYCCLIDELSINNNSCEIKGKDIKTLLDNEIILDYTTPNSFDCHLNKIIEKIMNEYLASAADEKWGRTPWGTNPTFYQSFEIKPEVNDDASLFGDLSNLYKVINVREFLQPYLKYYQSYITSEFSIGTNGEYLLKFIIKKRPSNNIEIDLDDFDSTPITKAGDEITDAIISNTDNTQYQHLRRYRSNMISEGEIIERPPLGSGAYHLTEYIHPKKVRYFISDNYADAMHDGVAALANAQYTTNVTIRNNKLFDSLNLEAIELYTMITMGSLVLPVVEKTITHDSNGHHAELKLGFKKTLLTEIIKEDKK